MEISLLKAVLNNISSFLSFPSFDDQNSDLVQKYYQRTEEILKLLKPVLDAILNSEIATNEVLCNAFEELSQSVDELRELLENWLPLLSKVYFVLQFESSISKVRGSGLDIFQFLKSSDQDLPDELSSSALEHCLQKLKHIGYEQTSSVIKQAVSDQVDESGPSEETLVKIADSLTLRSNEEILIEAVALEKLKENAEQSEKTAEVEFLDQLIALVTRMHERLVSIKQSETCSPVPIPPDFCCPLSLELMTDPVIVASGQTYERAYIKKWLDLGLTVCPKTRQTLGRMNLTPNYTVKALIANWCESNNVKLPDSTKAMSFAPPSPPSALGESGHARGQSMSPDYSRSPVKTLSASGIRSPLHPRSTSDGSLSSVAGIVQGLDIARMTLNNAEDRSSTEQRDQDSDQTNPGQSSLVHARSASASGVLSTSEFPRGASGNVNETSDPSNHLTNYSSDNSGEVKSEPRASASATPEYSPRVLDTRSRSSIWRRPSERLIPRIVSSPPIESRADLSGLETQVRALVEDLKSSSIDTQREATVELRLLAKHNMDNRIVIANSGAIALLVPLLLSSDARTQENAVTALLNLSINDNNKALIANADAIEPLIHVLETGSPEAKENSAATLFSLSVIEDNKVKIGRSGAIKPLVDLLGNGTPRGKRDAATALFNLSIFHENKTRIVQAGAVKHLVDLMDPAAGMVDKAVAVLANLATIPEGRTAIGQENGIPVLVEVVELGSARGKENAAAALLQLCTNSSRFCNLVLQEGAVPPLVALSQSGTPRAKEKAQTLLSYFRNQRHGNGGRG